MNAGLLAGLDDLANLTQAKRLRTYKGHIGHDSGYGHVVRTKALRRYKISTVIRLKIDPLQAN
ncbi:hypothetical protein E2C01_075505 [Portunus trituberculatus]|uniref:Uncharacterized protein n=1 Tax=Portunus trituberculatus TaxID=210409 RepID=A0A5B7IJB7_PORTR|nr:hypothetical protein [Portunus trituberculatus]